MPAARSRPAKRDLALPRILDELVEPTGDVSDPAGVSQPPELVFDGLFVQVGLVDHEPGIGPSPRPRSLAPSFEHVEDCLAFGGRSEILVYHRIDTEIPQTQSVSESHTAIQIFKYERA